jgi:hypothetical protein
MDYNCIAWAANDNEQWWWPNGPRTYWPKGVTKALSRAAFQEAFATLGYSVCNDGTHEPGFEKVVFYEKDGEIKHAARQETDGIWASKLGPHYDIRHHSPEALEDFGGVGEYGFAVSYMKRSFTAAS